MMSNETTQLQQVTPNTTVAETSFGNSVQFEHAQRVAKMLCSSNLIPKEYQGNVQNTMIALEMANRIGASPLMVMQNLYIVHGKPSWSGSFVIAALNSCGRFTPLRFEMKGEGMSLSCRAWAKDKQSGERLNGTTVTMEMAKAEGWIDKAGSKWKTMPEQMIQYRAGAFFGRLYAPDVLMGMPSEEEVDDFTVMASPEQEEMIRSLLMSSAYDERQSSIVEFKLNNGITSEEANKIINDLQNNQLDPINSGRNYNQGDIKKKQGELL